MFCENCGNKLAEGSAFCTNCGARVGGAPAAAPAAPAAAAPSPFATIVRKVKANKKVALIGAAALVVIVAVILVLTLAGGRTAEGTVQQFMDATVKADVTKIFELIPEDVKEYLAEEEGYKKSEIKKLIKEMEEDLKDSYESMEDYYGEFEMTYKIKGEEELSRSDLKDLKEEYSDIGVKVSEAKVFEVQVTMDFEDYGKEKNTMEIVVIKVGNNWYIDIMSVDLF